LSTYLVTGGAGFIGSHLVEQLVAEGHSVRVLDNFSTGKRENLEHLLDKIVLIEGCLTDLETDRQAVEGAEYVLHHGAIPSVPESVDDPIKSNSANIDGTLKLLVAARDAGVKRLVYASSSAVYGNAPTLPKREDMPGSPLSPYAVTKLTGEYYCQMFTQLYGFEAVSLRYFNVFGPRQDPNSHYAAVVPKFITAMLGREKPVIYGDGLQTRDFTYVRNNVEANLLACKAPAAAGDILNIASGESYTLLDLVSALNTIIGTSIEPIHEPERPGEVKHSAADISKADKLIGFTPSVRFMDGLEELVKWTRDKSA
jgi:nucleoside-diphosphate-sugar epimerase